MRFAIFSMRLARNIDAACDQQNPQQQIMTVVLQGAGFLRDIEGPGSGATPPSIVAVSVALMIFAFSTAMRLGSGGPLQKTRSTSRCNANRSFVGSVSIEILVGSLRSAKPRR